MMSISSRLCHRLQSSQSRLDPVRFFSSADINLLLLIASNLKLRMTPLHALHDTSSVIIGDSLSEPHINGTALYVCSYGWYMTIMHVCNVHAVCTK